MQNLDVVSIALIGGTGLVAGLVNAIAGGGSLISFPVLVAAGLPAVTANITNTVALCPGYFGGAFAQRRDLVGQRSRMMMLLPTSLIGGVLGGLLLLWTGEKAFDILVPFLLLFAVALLAFQNQLQAFTMARKHGAHSETWSIVPVGIAAIYGGYFGAALGVILLAVLVVVVDDSLIRLNALKQLVSTRGQRQCRSRVFVFGANRLDNHTGHGNRCADWRCDRRRDRLSRSCKTAPLDRDCGRPRNVGRLLRPAI
jgi:uncharacterized membrane protein YfcA